MMGIDELNVCMITSKHHHFDLLNNCQYMRGNRLKHIVFTNTDEVNESISGIRALGKKQINTAINEDEIIYIPNNCGLSKDEIHNILANDIGTFKKVICDECFVVDRIRNGWVSNRNIPFCSNDLSECPVPIVLIASDKESVNKLSVTLRLRDELEKKHGLKVAVISGNEHSRLFEFYSFPSIHDLNMKSPTNIIGAIKKYINDVNKQNSPDVILISLPGGIFDLEEHNNYDSEFEFRYIDYAVNIDYLIFITSFDNCQSAVSINNAFLTRYGHKPDCLILSNRVRVVDGMHSEDCTSNNVITVNDSIYLNKINSINSNGAERIFMLGEEDSVSSLIISTLDSEYERFEIL